MALTILAIRNVDASSPVANSTQSFNGTNLEANITQEFGDWRRNATPLAFVTEGWSEGFMLGSLIIMACITIANMRKGVFLHKLVLLELLLAMLHGTFCFMNFKGYGWYLSATAAPLYWSYFTHNVVAWIKIRPFFTPPCSSFTPSTCKWVTWIFLSTLIATIPITVFQIINNFRFFSSISSMYTLARPYESIFRDPWWLFSIFTLFHIIRTSYKFPVLHLIKRSPRFGILLVAIFLSMAFTFMDILSIIIPSLSVVDGINPYWKLALVFKCLTDNIILDDFKTTLRKLGAISLQAAGGPQPNDVESSSRNKSAVPEFDNPWGNLSSRERRTSISGRALDPNEVLDDAGRGRRKTSLVALGRVGTKIRRLPHLPSLSPSTWRQGSTVKVTIKEDVPLTGNMTVISSGAPDEHVNSITMKTVISSSEEPAGHEDNESVPKKTFPGDGRGDSKGSGHVALVPKGKHG